MDSLDLLKDKSLTPVEWLTYYKNLWSKNCIARVIDVKSDKMIKDKDPMTLVTEYDTEFGQPTGREVPVRERLETRKMMLRDAIKIHDSIAVLLDDCKNEQIDFNDKYMSEKALAVDADMFVEQKGEVDTTADVTPSEEAKTE